MLKRLFLTAFAAILCCSMTAQEKIKQVVTSDYNRNSVSMVAIQRGDSYDSATTSAVASFSPGEKFDINRISTKTLRISKLRSEAVYQSEVDGVVGGVGFAREILASIFNRDSKGMMNDKTVRYRGNYDAKDQDVINARAARVGEDALGDLGQKLVAASYVVVNDFYKIERKTDKRGNVYWSTNARAYAYKLDLDESTLYDFYEKCWIYDEDDEAARAAKISAFNNLAIGLVPVASASTSATSSTVEDAAAECLSGLITGLENQISDWEVAVTVSARHPLRAKIGTKEGLKNGDRYRAYSYREDNNGNLVSVPRGFLRATEVSSNTGMSIGETEPSEFYQISGLANIDEGWTIKQSNDLGLGVMAGIKTGSMGKLSLAVDIDFLMDVKTGGSMSYALFSGSFDLKQANYVPIFFGIGYGYGLHLSRFFEVMPYAMIGMDHIGYSSTDNSKDRFVRESALVLEPGVRAAVNVAYPLQVFVKAFVDWNPEFIQGSLYKIYNETVGHKSGFGLQAGLKWTF